MADQRRFILQVWKRVAGIFREFGAIHGVLYAVDQVLRRLSPSCGVYPYEFYLQPIGDRPLLPPALLKTLSAERLAPGHALLAVVPVPQPVLAARFAHGAQAVVALRNAEPLGYAWWCKGTYQEQEVRCTFEVAASEAAVFDFDVYVLPAHRMGLGFMSVWHVFMEQLRDAGVTHSYSRISAFNLASRRAHARLGARVIGRAVFVRLGPLSLALTGRFPYARAALGDGCGLRMRLDTQGVHG